MAGVPLENRAQLPLGIYPSTCHETWLVISGGEASSSSRRMTVEEPTISPNLLLFAGIQQLPPINKFSWEEQNGKGKGFKEWIEQFELITELYNWDAQVQFINLTYHTHPWTGLCILS